MRTTPSTPPGDLCNFGAPGGHQTCRDPDLAIARLADRQHGVVARRQLLALGVTAKTVRTRLARRQLIELHRGVYAVGHRHLTRNGEWMAGVLAAGLGAVLSHYSAAGLHELRDERTRRVFVTTATSRATTRRLAIRGRAVLAPQDVTIRDRIPVTTVPRTLVDLSDVLGPRQLSRAVNEADVNGMLDLDEIVAVLGRLRGRPGRGARALRAALETHCGPVVLRSELEQRFRELLADRALPRADHNIVLEGWEVDACWEEQRLVVELDSRFHDTPAARRKDAAKSRALRAAGWEVVRYRWRDVVGAPAATAHDLRARLTGRPL